MSVKYKVIERGQPGVAGGGEKKFYASANVSGEFTLKELTKEVEKRSTVGGTDIRAVIYALLEVAISEVARGNIVRLGELGSLRVSISSEGKENANDVNANAIKSAKVVFTPGEDIKEMLKTLTYEKIS